MPDREPARSPSPSGRSEPLAVRIVLGVCGGIGIGIFIGGGLGLGVAFGVGGVVIGVVIGVIIDLIVKASGHADRVGSSRRYASGSVLRKAGRLLPATEREEYVEEWRSWLWDMRETGQPWYRRLVELLGIVLIAAPRLAITLRLGRRVVD